MTDQPEVLLADVLAVAAERGRLVEADRLLREAFGPEVVNAAHRTWTDRLRKWVEGPADDGPAGRTPAETVPAGTRDTPPKASAERSGSPAEPSEAALHLIRRLPDPVTGGQAGQADR